MIYNHISSRLSELDMLIVNSVPPGGNWKNIPETVPSQRIKQIRESFAAGKGSRSTYYGRLLATKPAYTINTYFNRPGNGCHIHYGQNRVLSQREAARLQSFPDNFVFEGNQGSVNTQIGNAVPPLLGYQIADQVTKSIGQTGAFVDLFSGAGGLGLGFKWAAWMPIVANDIDSQFLKTYSRNIHERTIAGSITEREVFDQLVAVVKNFQLQNPWVPLWVLGGPPCQGFSTAGNRRTMDDERNSLFLHYRSFLQKVRPDGFIFENVSGLLNMEGGKVFEKVKSEFSNVMPNLKAFVLCSENYAIPQRRKRVFLIGQKNTGFQVEAPEQITSLSLSNALFDRLAPCITVEDAIGDLPPLVPGQSGVDLPYVHEPKSAYQRFMRGLLQPSEYLSITAANPYQSPPGHIARVPTSGLG